MELYTKDKWAAFFEALGRHPLRNRFTVLDISDMPAARALDDVLTGGAGQTFENRLGQSLAQLAQMPIPWGELKKATTRRGGRGVYSFKPAVETGAPLEEPKIGNGSKFFKALARHPKRAAFIRRDVDDLAVECGAVSPDKSPALIKSLVDSILRHNLGENEWGTLIRRYDVQSDVKRGRNAAVWVYSFTPLSIAHAEIDVAFGEESPVPVAQSSASPFDAIRQEDERGEYWSARDLMPLLGYDKWERFEDAIDRAKASGIIQGLDMRDHFPSVGKMVQIGSNAQRVVTDYRLTRFACYLVAMNGDPRKPEIAEAQGYFVVQTRKAEVMAEKQADFSQLERLAGITAQAIEVKVNEVRAEMRSEVHALRDEFERIKPISEAQAKTIHDKVTALAPYVGGYGVAWKMFKDRMQVAKYDRMPAVQFDEAIEFLDGLARVYKKPDLFDESAD